MEEELRGVDTPVTNGSQRWLLCHTATTENQVQLCRAFVQMQPNWSVCEAISSLTGGRRNCRTVTTKKS
jgi:hypothetical protein